MAKRDTYIRLLAALLLLISGNIAATAPVAASAASDTPGIDIPRGPVGVDIIPHEVGSGYIFETLSTFDMEYEAIPLQGDVKAEFPQKVWSPYMEPYSLHGSKHPNWHRMWVNTAVLSGAFVSTLFVLECLPEDATSWNRAAIQSRPPLERWYRNIFKLNPEIDQDNPIFNYVLHPYAGAAYFMAARSCGFSFWGSLLYSALISTVGWEFGVEACMERPSYQDIVITPVVGSIIGELFYKCKRHIVEHDYTLWGSRFLGNVVVFLVDPVNEVVNLFRGSYERKLHLGRENPSVLRERPLVSSTLTPAIVGGAPGFSLTCTF